MRLPFIPYFLIFTASEALKGIRSPPFVISEPHDVSCETISADHRSNA